MPNIFDNLTDETRLGPALQDSLHHFDTVDVATGYFDLRGWREFAGILDDRQDDVATRPIFAGAGGYNCGSIRLGSDPRFAAGGDSAAAVRLGHPRPREGASPTRPTRGPSPQSADAGPARASEASSRLQALKQQLESGLVQMRVFTEKPLHGKTYIFHAPTKGKFGRGKTYVGSSSLTGRGTPPEPGAQHRRPRTASDREKLSSWVQDRWNDPFSLEISAEIIELISESWADPVQPTPFEFARVCHALSEGA